MEEVLSVALESRGPVWHDPISLGGPNFAAEVRLARLAELALLTLGRAVYKFSFPVQSLFCAHKGFLLKCDDVVSRLYRGHPVPN